jgi:hypothetical protein
MTRVYLILWNNIYINHNLNPFDVIVFIYMIILMETCKYHHGYLNNSFRIHSYIHTCKYKYIFYYDLNIITFCYATMNVFFNKSHWNFKYCLICIKWEEIFKLRYCATRYKKIHFQRYRFFANLQGQLILQGKTHLILLFLSLSNNSVQLQTGTQAYYM